MLNMSTFRGLFLGGLLALGGCGTGTNVGTPSLDTATTSSGCTLTQGYWKNHPTVWPVTSLKLGTVSYTEAQLLSILGAPVKGNGLIDLAHQLIAAKLNVAAGASPAAITTTISAADALIGSLVVPPVGSGSLSTSTTSALVGQLDAYNSGTIGPGHCGNQPPPPPPVCGNGILEPGEQCDDGNLVNGDGCSSTCTIETPPPPPVCGNGIVEAGEQCDDGNLINGDGCSCTCTLE